MKWNFVTGSTENCSHCLKPTRGHLSNGTTSIPCCPRCRDTKSIFLSLTGSVRDDVQVSSDRSRATEVNIPAQDQMPPMLARAFKEVKPEHMKSTVWESLNWIAGEKYNGVRITGYIRDNTIYYLSRNKSKATGLYVDKSQHVPHLRPETPFEWEDSVFDGELLWVHGPLDTGSVVTNNQLNAAVALTNCDPDKSIELQTRFGKLVIVVFDVLKEHGKDIRTWTLGERIQVRHQLVQDLSKLVGTPHLFREEEYVYGNRQLKEQFYKSILDAGGEGIMLKDLNSQYCTNATSRPVAWVKVKRRNTVDGFITGWKPGEAGFTGLVGALEISVYGDDGQPVEIAMVSNIHLEERRQMTAPDGSLKPEYYGRVVEVSFQERSARAGRGVHATLDNWRPDKDQGDCTIEAMTLS